MNKMKTTTISPSRLQKILFLYVSIALLALTLFLSFATVLPTYSRLKSAEDRNIYHAVKTRAMAINEWARRAKDLARQITSRTRIRQELEKYNNKKIALKQLRSFTKPKLSDAMSLSKEIIGITRLDIEGQAVATCGLNIPRTEWPVSAFETKDIVISSPFIAQNCLAMIVGAPILNRKGQHVGTDLVLIDTSELKTIAMDYTGLGESSEIILGYSSGNQIRTVFPLRKQDNQLEEKTVSLDFILQVLLENIIDGKEGLEIIDKTIMAYIPIEVCHWGLLITQSEDELYAPLRSILIRTGLISILFYLALLFGFWFALKPLSGRLLLHSDELEATIQEKTLHLQKEISERKQVEKALLESEERFRTVADFTYDWEIWIGPDGHHIYVSPSCERITGYGPEAFINDPGLLEKIVHPDDHSAIVNHLGEEKDQERLPSIDFRITTRSGEVRWINHVCQSVYGADGTYLGRRGSNRDVSKEKVIQEELLKAKKLESLGVLAGGIAHDFNNLMSAVVGYISLARMEMKPGSKGFKNLIEAEKASIQTKGLTARLITFSKGGGPIKETVSIGDLVKDSVDSSLKGSDLDARFSIPDDISPVEIDEEQMKQAVHNIIANAQEAMAEQGMINVSCENIDIGVQDTLTLKDGKYVKISIEDQGPGIPEEDLIKIFDPYFSTKEMGTQKGMGLGLSASDSIVKQHDGIITVESELGTGTTFSIYLPACVKEIVEAALVKKPVPEISVTQGGKILVMDDEEVIRDVCNALLTHLGYEAEVAVEGVEAIEMYRKAMESEKPFDMVILDLTNKVGMGGAETMAKLLEIDPAVKAIVATGYSNDPIISNFREHGFRSPLPKPFTLDQLKTALQDAFAGE